MKNSPTSIYSWLIVALIGGITLATAQRILTLREEIPESEHISLDTAQKHIIQKVKKAWPLKMESGTTPKVNASVGINKAWASDDTQSSEGASVDLGVEDKWIFWGEEAKIKLSVNLGKTSTLNHVYVDHEKWKIKFRVGKSSTNFCDPDACSLASGSFIQFRGQYQYNETISITGALESTPKVVTKPEKGVEEAIKDEEEKPRETYKDWGGISANVRYARKHATPEHAQAYGLVKWLNRLTHAQFSVVGRPLQHEGNRNLVLTYGVNVGAALELVPEKTTVKTQFLYGCGIGDYTAELSGLTEENNIIYKTKTDTLKTLNAWGIAFTISHKWTPKISSEGAFKWIQALDGARGTGAYQQGHVVSLGTYYHPNKRIKIGGVYTHKHTEKIGGDVDNKHDFGIKVGVTLWPQQEEA